MVAQDERLKASFEALVNMKVQKLYAWENHFKNAIERSRKVELKLCCSVTKKDIQDSYFLVFIEIETTF